MKKLIIMALIATFALWGFRLFSTSFFKQNLFNSFENPELTSISLNTQTPEPGVYVYPNTLNKKTAPIQSTIDAARVYCLINKTNSPSPFQEAYAFLISFFISFLMGWLLSLLKSPSFFNTLLISGTIGTLIGLYRLLYEGAFFTPPFPYITLSMTDSILSLLIVGTCLHLSGKLNLLSNSTSI